MWYGAGTGGLVAENRANEEGVASFVFPEGWEGFEVVNSREEHGGRPGFKACLVGMAEEGHLDPYEVLHHATGDSRVTAGLLLLAEVEEMFGKVQGVCRGTEGGRLGRAKARAASKWRGGAVETLQSR